MKNTHTRFQSALFLAAASAMLLLAPATQAATSTWSGGGTDGNWQTIANWDAVPVPSTTMDLLFDGSTQLNTNNNFAGGSAFGNLTFAPTAGTFTLAGNPIALTGNITNDSSALQTINLDIANGGNTTIFTTVGNIVKTGNILGAGGVTKTGAGKLTLQYGNYTGTTTVSAGTLALSYLNGIAQSSLTVDGATAIFDIAGLAIPINNSTSINPNSPAIGYGTGGAGVLVLDHGGTIMNSGGTTGAGFWAKTADLRNGTISVPLNVTNLVKSGTGTVTLNSTVASPLTEVLGGTLVLNTGNNGLGYAPITVNGSTAVLDLRGTQQHLGGTNPDAVYGGVNTLVLDNGGTINDTLGGGYISNLNTADLRSGTVSATLYFAGKLYKSTSGTVTINNAPSNAPSVTEVLGGTLVLNATLGYTAFTVSGASAVLDFHGTNQHVGQTNPDSTYSGNNILVLDNGATITNTIAGGGTLDNIATADLRSGTVNVTLNMLTAGKLYKTGSGTVTLSKALAGANIAVKILGGTLLLNSGASNALNYNSSSLTVDGSTAVLDLHGFDQVLSNTLVNSDSTIAGGTGALVLDHGGTLTSSTGSPSLSGYAIADLRDGTVNVKLSAGKLYKSGTGTVTINQPANGPAVTEVLGGTLLLNASLSYTPITVSGGTLDIHGIGQAVGGTNPDAVYGGSNTLVLDNGGTITDTLGGGSISNIATAELRSGIVNAALTINSKLYKTTAGTVTLNKGISNDLPVKVLGGTLVLNKGSANTLGIGSSLTVDGATSVLDLAGFNQQFSSTAVNADTTINGGVGALVLDHGGTLTSSSGTPSLFGFAVSDLRDGTVNVKLNPGKLYKTGPGTVTINATPVNAPTLTKVSAGNLVLNATLGYNPITVDGATAILDLRGGNQNIGGTNPDATHGGSNTFVLDNGGIVTSTLGAATLSNVSIAELRNGTVDANVTLNSYAKIIKDTAGTVNLYGTVNLTDAADAVTVNAGVLNVGNGVSGSFSSPHPALAVVTVASNATISFNEANAAVQVNPITDNGTVNGAVSTAGNTNRLSGAITGTGSVTQTGLGTLILAGTNGYSGGTTVSQGTLLFNSAAARPTGDVLTINKTGAKGPVVVVGGDAANLDNYRTALASGYNGGTWTGTSAGAITSVTAQTASDQGIGYLTTNQYNVLNGTNLAAGGVILKYTYLGDISLKGYIDASDFAQIDASWLKGTYAVSGAKWINGDFDYDGKITTNDFALIDAAYALHGGPLAAGIVAGDLTRFAGTDFASQYQTALRLGAAGTVPEPASLGLLAMGALGLLGRRRR